MKLLDIVLFSIIQKSTPEFQSPVKKIVTFSSVYKLIYKIIKNSQNYKALSPYFRHFRLCSLTIILESSYSSLYYFSQFFLSKTQHKNSKSSKKKLKMSTKSKLKIKCIYFNWTYIFVYTPSQLYFKPHLHLCIFAWVFSFKNI